MESDDDFHTSPPMESSPLEHKKRLRRLKKYSPKPARAPSPERIDDPLFCSSVDFAKLEALEKCSETLDFDDSNSSEDPILSQESLSQGIETENGDEKECGPEVEVKKTRRVLDFEDDGMDRVDEQGIEMEMEEGQGFDPKEIDKENVAEEFSFEEKDGYTKKKKRMKSESGGGSNAKARVPNKRREEKERKSYLKELHVESQRLLRESRDAAFEPIPVVQKPISSVLEKIRKRKLEISKRAIFVNDSSYGVNTSHSDKIMDIDVSDDEKREDGALITMEKKMVASSPDGENSLDASKEVEERTGHESHQSPSSLNEELTPAFRAPADDTQDLFDDSEPNDATVQQHVEQISSPLEKDIAPSLRSMNLKFDSAPADGSSSDEEENDKENIDPYRPGAANLSSSPRGDPVKDFLDDEAEEEEDSDNDLKDFQDNEENEDTEDFEELKDMIATEYEERPIDNERRNELHQKWLEQQDAAGTDSLLQKLKFGPELKDMFLPDNEPESEDDEEYDDEAGGDAEPRNSMRVNTRKAKEIILQLFPDKEDVYLSDEDDNAHRRHAQRLLIRKEEQATLVSPAEDENSREVFGLIKKLNIASEPKKRPKLSSFFDSVLLQKGNSSSSSKSSFLGRASNHPISSSHKQGSGTFRSFIFGRDDSNSRSSISVSDDSSETVSQESRPSRSFTAKFSNSQAKLSTQTRDAGATEAVSRTSLLEILKRSSSQSQACNQVNSVDLTKSIFAFRVPKKPMKVEGRS